MTAVASPADVLAAREAELLDEHPDPTTAALEKCKPAAHLRVIIERTATSVLVVRYVAALACRNPQEGPNPTWGALLDPAGRQIGMHLFPDAVDLLAYQLPIAAAQARAATGTDWAVSIQHTVRKSLSTWRSVVPGDADAIAAALGAMHA